MIIANALAVNESLYTLMMYGNPISGEGIWLILQAELTITTPSCPPAIKEKMLSIKH